MMHKNTRFRAYLYSAGTEHGSLHQLSVTMRRVTYFILWPTQEPALVTATTGKIQAIFFEKKKTKKKTEGEWTGKVEISTEEIAGSRLSMHGYTLSYSRL